MKISNLTTAENIVNRAFETTGKSLRIVLMEVGVFYVCTPKEAIKLVKQGYQLA